MCIRDSIVDVEASSEQGDDPAAPRVHRQSFNHPTPQGCTSKPVAIPDLLGGSRAPDQSGGDHHARPLTATLAAVQLSGSPATSAPPPGASQATQGTGPLRVGDRGGGGDAAGDDQA